MALFSALSKISCFFLVSVARAYVVFETTCSTPPAGVNFVSSPNSRGTLDILWSCLFTIFACTWTLQHPNIPKQCHGYRQKRTGVGRTARLTACFLRSLKSFLRGANGMVLTIIAPEIIIGVAYNCRLQAHEDYPVLKQLADEDCVPWSLTHTYYANMGGFVLKKGENDENTNDYNLHHLSGRELYKLREGNYIEKLPNMTEEELLDRSKGDPVIKIISVVQIVWSTMQIMVRAAKKLSICPLELSVLAFAACAIIIYGLYWDKPKSIGASTTIALQHQDYRTWAAIEFEENDNDKTINLLLPTVNCSFGSPMHVTTGRGSRDNMKFAIPTAASMLMGMILFGAIHIGAWNFGFPSTAELVLWRCASVYSVLHASVALLAAVCICKSNDGGNNRLTHFLLDIMPGWFGMVLFSIVLLLYIAARLILLVEMFRTLCFLPPDAFVSTWASNIPHIA